MTQVSLAIRDLHYSRVSDWTRTPVPLLRGISLDVWEGESFGFLGHNGAGKTTTIKCILDLIRYQRGEIRIFGIDSRKTESRAQVGFLPEQPYFYDNLTVRETLELYGVLANSPAKTRIQRIDEIVNIFGLGGKINSRMRTLSKGLTQRVGMAQAILNRPRLLVLDEPFSGLDPVGRKEFRDLLVDLKEKGTTIFMSSHILSDVEFLCDRASILVQGELRGVYDMKHLPSIGGRSFELIVRKGVEAEKLLDGVASMATATRENGVDMVSLSFSDGEVAQRALALASQLGCTVESFSSHGGSLEDIFVSVVKGS